MRTTGENRRSSSGLTRNSTRSEATTGSALQQAPLLRGRRFGEHHKTLGYSSLTTMAHSYQDSTCLRSGAMTLQQPSAGSASPPSERWLNSRAAQACRDLVARGWRHTVSLAVWDVAHIRETSPRIPQLSRRSTHPLQTSRRLLLLLATSPTG